MDAATASAVEGFQTYAKTTAMMSRRSQRKPDSSPGDCRIAEDLGVGCPADRVATNDNFLARGDESSLAKTDGIDLDFANARSTAGSDSRSYVTRRLGDCVTRSLMLRDTVTVSVRPRAGQARGREVPIRRQSRSSGPGAISHSAAAG